MKECEKMKVQAQVEFETSQRQEIEIGSRDLWWAQDCVAYYGKANPNFVPQLRVHQQASCHPHTLVNHTLVVELLAGTGMVDRGCRSAVGGKLFQRTKQESAASGILPLWSWRTTSFSGGDEDHEGGQESVQNILRLKEHGKLPGSWIPCL